MKKLLLSSIVIAALFFASCEEDFNPKTEFDKKYIVNFVIKGDSIKQVAVVGALYEIDGYDPMANTQDPLISGATIELITDKGEVFTMKDTTGERRDSLRYEDPMPFYVLNELKPRQFDSLRLRAIMPDGTILTASTMVPRSIYISGRETYISGTHPEVEGDNFVVTWQSSQNVLFKYQLNVYYYINYDDGSREVGQKEIPISYTGSQPEYPGVTRSRTAGFSREAIDSVFSQIKREVPKADMIQIIYGRFDMLIYDEHLSNYYSSTHGYLDEFSIRLDETVYTNIEGGLGVFGSYLKVDRTFPFFADYISSFGFNQ